MDFNNLIEKEQLLYSKGFYYFDKYSPVIMYEMGNPLLIHVRREIKLREYNEIDDSVFDVMFRESADLEQRIQALRIEWNNIVLYFKQLKIENQLQQLEKDFE
jgi:hypothetical protein